MMATFRSNNHPRYVYQEVHGVRSTTECFVRLVARISLTLSAGQSCCLWKREIVPALSAAGMLLAMSGCGTTHAILNFTAPPTATAGVPFTVTVAVTISGHPDTVINSRLHFTSSDPAAVLPGDYYFMPADAGSHTWPGGFILRTPGNQTISGEIIDAIGINGSASVSVSP